MRKGSSSAYTAITFHVVAVVTTKVDEKFEKMPNSCLHLLMRLPLDVSLATGAGKLKMLENCKSTPACIFRALNYHI